MSIRTAQVGPQDAEQPSRKKRKYGTVLASSLRSRLQKVAARLGADETAAKIGINSVTLMRAMSGLPILRATAQVIEHLLESLEAQSSL